MSPTSALLSAGSRVKYRATFCRSIGAYTGAIPFARGRVTSLDSFGSVALACVAWDDPSELPARVNVANLIAEHAYEPA